MNPEKFELPSNLKNCQSNVWIEYSKLAQEYNPINLGSGTPNFNPPKILVDALKDVTSSNEPSFHQYARSAGHPRLVKSISKMYSPLLLRRIDPMENILITVGATEALYCAIMSFIKPKDEVIVIEPFFDSYEHFINMAQGKARYIPLTPIENTDSTVSWKYNEFELKSMFNSKTKMIILNTPHNPTGKMFTKDELSVIAEFCTRWDVLCVTDEVYEWLGYPPHQHERIATLPNMWERTITISSAGKTFAATGWKIGWAIGPANLIEHLQVIHQHSIYTCCTPLQEALARIIEKEYERLYTSDSHLFLFPVELEKKRDFTMKFLKDFGLKPYEPNGGFFILADFKDFASKVNLSEETDQYLDFKFTKWMIKNIGIQTLPVSFFYSKEHKHLGENYIRICFIKDDEYLEKAAKLLEDWKNKTQQ